MRLPVRSFKGRVWLAGLRVDGGEFLVVQLGRRDGRRDVGIIVKCFEGRVGLVVHFWSVRHVCYRLISTTR